MISDVDQALEALVRREALNGSRVDVLFDAPTRDWVARRNSPTLDIYLYDIREDTARRQIVPELVRDQATRVAGARRMP
ncbi:MAG TPA: Pvc16 family protein, partial [Candidatus Limnocylindrales bacterium]